MKLIKKLLTTTNIIVVLLTLLTYLNVIIPPQKLFIFPVLGLFYPLLFFANCLFIVIWLFQDVRWMIPSAACLILGWNQFTGFVGLNNPEYDKQNKDLTVMTYNTHRFYDAHKQFKNSTSKKIASFFADQARFDFICLQEFDQLYADEIKMRLPDYEMVQFGDKRTIILSKYPRIAMGEVDFGTRTNACIWADFVVGEDTIRIYTLHLLSTRISGEADQVLDNIDLQERSTWRGLFSILSKYGESSILRKDQATLVRQHMEASPYPIILTGDFNEPPASFVYSYLCQNLQDTFREKAEGMTSTYRGRIPFLRIDYILTSPVFKTVSYETLTDIPYSDHNPIVATIRLSPE